MGLSASQARFLQLTARRSNVEYQAQQIAFERLQLSNSLSQITNIYEDKTTNRKMVFNFNDGTGSQTVDISYRNYMNYMNSNSATADNQYFLLNTSGKIVVSSEEEMQTMIANTTKTVKTTNDDGTETSTEIEFLTTKNFEIVTEGLDDVDNFQQSIKDGIYYFATLDKEEETFDTKSWETMSGGSITEVYDTTDDAAAEATYKKESDRIQTIDKKLELKLDQLESERSAIQTEIDSVKKVIEDNIEATFNKFS